MAVVCFVLFVEKGRCPGVVLTKFSRVVGSPSYVRYALLARLHTSNACIAVITMFYSRSKEQ
jgi:hypothetical protein